MHEYQLQTHISHKKDDNTSLYSFTSDGVLLDPYTMSLLRYNSREMDLYICQQTCPLQPKLEYNNMRYNKPSRQIKATIIPLHVGYLSNDWRDHPMGRLTSNLVTTHSVSKRFSSQSDDFTANDGNIEGNNIRTINKITTYRNIMNCRDDYNHHHHISSKHLRIRNYSHTYDSHDENFQNHHHHHHHCNYGDRIYASALSYGSNDHSDIRTKVMKDSFEFLDYSSILNDVDVAEDIHKRQFDIIVDITGNTIYSIIPTTTTTSTTAATFTTSSFTTTISTPTTTTTITSTTTTPIASITTNSTTTTTTTTATTTSIPSFLNTSHHTGHTCNGRIDIVALKPAPLIINYLGFPGTTGCEGFSYTTVST